MTKYEGTKLQDFAPIDQVTELQVQDIFEGKGLKFPLALLSPLTTLARYAKMVSFSKVHMILVRLLPSRLMASSKAGPKVFPA